MLSRALRAFVVAAGHVDLQQEAVGFIAPRRRGELLEVGFESHDRIVKRVERKLVGQLGVVEEGVLLDVEVKFRRGGRLEGLLGPRTITHFEVAIGHVVGGILSEFIFPVRREGGSRRHASRQGGSACSPLGRQTRGCDPDRPPSCQLR